MGRKFRIKLSAFVCVFLGLVVDAAIRLSGQTAAPEADRFQPGSGVHETRVQPESLLQFLYTNEISPQPEPVSPPAPTRSTFMATWERVSGARGYLLDVSTNSSFTTYLDGYRESDIGDATGR